MHQPDYRDRGTGEFRMPWVYLHAMKDYADMAWHLERHPRMRAVVNFVPVLLDQLEDYTDQFATGRLRDPLLRVLSRAESTPLSRAERDLIVDQCFHANHAKMVLPFPPYKGLHDLFRMLEAQGRDAFDYLADRYFYDLVTWYHLAWTGETVRRESELVARMMASGAGFVESDRRALFELIGELIAGVIPRYAALAQRGQIELSTTPHGHPLAPLLIDFQSAREVKPGLPLPEAQVYPGGLERTRAHLDSAISTHAARFGRAPTGVWPAEGAVSTALLKLLGERGLEWAASGEGVLVNSLRELGQSVEHRAEYLYRPYRFPSDGRGLTVFFRDDPLSDLIGFEYAKWHSSDAVADFVAKLDAIAQRATRDETPIVSVILDGENCWEFYPYNGFYFLDSLYAQLASHASVRPTTFADVCRQSGEAGGPRAKPGWLPRVAAGSWVYGDFTTWIGSPEKNRAWDLLAAAKASFDRVIASGRLSEAERTDALRVLERCEASDWFWWMGDYNPAHAVESFDRLFRDNLARLHELLHLPVPASLAQPISRGGGHPEVSGAMRRAS